MSSSKVLRFCTQSTKLLKINGIPIGRRFSTSFHPLRQYSKVAGIAGAGILSFIAYGLTSDFKAYAQSRKKVSTTNQY